MWQCDSCQDGWFRTTNSVTAVMAMLLIDTQTSWHYHKTVTTPMK